jgi:hypothetical protein
VLDGGVRKSHTTTLVVFFHGHSNLQYFLQVTHWLKDTVRDATRTARAVVI